VLEHEVLGLELAEGAWPISFDRFVECAEIGWLQRLYHWVVQVGEQITQAEHCSAGAAKQVERNAACLLFSRGKRNDQVPASSTLDALTVLRLEHIAELDRILIPEDLEALFAEQAQHRLFSE